jgi:mobilome CxxCx(11)CxxC protein
MKRQEIYERKETWDKALFALAIPLSIVYLAFAKTKTCPFAKNQKTDNTDKPKSKDQIEAEMRAVDCFGTARLLEKKRKTIKFFSKANKFIGLAIPLIFGTLYTLSNDKSLIPKLEPIIPIIQLITAILGLALLIISLLALVNDWDTRIENYTKSIPNNMRYHDTFCEIVERYYEDEKKYAALYRKTKSLDDMQQEKDGIEDFSIKDRQFITKHGLHQLDIKCPECKKVPDITKSGKCGNCGT